MELLAQIGDSGPDNQPGLWFLLHSVFLSGVFSLLSLAYGVFWLWMLIQCLRSEPDRFFWIWLFIIAPFPGAIVYAVLRYFPTREHSSPAFLRKWTRGKELARLETAAEQIGNPHQFIQWGDALCDVGNGTTLKTPTIGRSRKILKMCRRCGGRRRGRTSSGFRVGRRFDETDSRQGSAI